MFYDSPTLQGGQVYQFSKRDREILRGLALKVKEAAADPRIEIRRQLWKSHNSLKTKYPLMLVFPEGAWRELIQHANLRCEEESAREIELDLRKRLYKYDHFTDDSVIEDRWVVRKVIHHSGWGLEERWIPSSDPHGAKGFDPVLHEPADLQKLKFPTITYDEQASRYAAEQLKELFGDLLVVDLEGLKHISYHLMAELTALRGYQETMLDFYVQPQFIHDAMAFLEEGHRRLLEQVQAQNLLSLNNDNTYQSSGGNGFTTELPAAGFDPDRVRPIDLWASAESQEMAQVSPEQHAEFALRYEKRLLEPFGLTGYGCCEDLTDKLEDVFEIPNLRRISVSPWADVERCAEKIQDRYIYSWKPTPVDLIGDFNPGKVREYLRHTVQVTKTRGCVLEMILKDTHTCEDQPEKFQAWTQIAREVIREEYGEPL